MSKILLLLFAPLIKRNFDGENPSSKASAIELLNQASFSILEILSKSAVLRTSFPNPKHGRRG